MGGDMVGFLRNPFLELGDVVHLILAEELRF